MLPSYNPWVRNDGSAFYTAVDPEGSLANTGDGHKMGMWVGANYHAPGHRQLTPSWAQSRARALSQVSSVAP